MRFRSLGDKLANLLRFAIKLFSSLRLRMPTWGSFLGALGGRSIGGASGVLGGSGMILGFGRLFHNQFANRNTIHTIARGVIPAVHSSISWMYQGTLQAYCNTSLSYAYVAFVAKNPNLYLVRVCRVRRWSSCTASRQYTFLADSISVSCAKESNSLHRKVPSLYVLLTDWTKKRNATKNKMYFIIMVYHKK